jgi:transposase
MPKCRFTREFQDEAVRLILSSGRSQRAIADNLGVNRSTLARWMAEHQDTRPASAAPPNEDVMDELKRLRRENEVLH